jgi:hypothetical protein
VNKPKGNGSGGHYKVAYSQLVQETLKQLLERARARGILSEVLAAVKEIDSRLHRDPTVFGEPHLNLKHGKGQLRTAFVRPLAVVYAVYEGERKVLVTKPLQPLPETGL